MRIIKSGNARIVWERPCTCMNCKCEFVFREDEAHLVADPRDGDYFRIGCPECRMLNSVSTDVPTVTVIPQP
jgi:hypothetical protein